MEAKYIKWCPQHGYPLPCDKCGMPLSQASQKEIYRAAIREAVEWIKTGTVMRMARGDRYFTAHTDTIMFQFPYDEWQAKKAEWGLKEE